MRAEEPIRETIQGGLFVGTSGQGCLGRFRDKVAKSASPLTSNSVVVLINRVLNWAVDEGLIDVNPAARLRKVAERKPRERILSHAGIVTFWQALDAMGAMTGEHMARAEKGRMLSPATRSVLSSV